MPIDTLLNAIRFFARDEFTWFVLSWPLAMSLYFIFAACSFQRRFALREILSGYARQSRFSRQAMKFQSEIA